MDNCDCQQLVTISPLTTVSRKNKFFVLAKQTHYDDEEVVLQARRGWIRRRFGSTSASASSSEIGSAGCAVGCAVGCVATCASTGASAENGFRSEVVASEKRGSGGLVETVETVVTVCGSVGSLVGSLVVVFVADGCGAGTRLRGVGMSFSSQEDGDDGEGGQLDGLGQVGEVGQVGEDDRHLREHRGTRCFRLVQHPAQIHGQHNNNRPLSLHQ